MKPAPCGRPSGPGPPSASTPRGHVDAPRPDPADGVGHVVGVEAAGAGAPRGPGGPSASGPVEDLARAGRRRVDHDHVGAVARRPGRAPGRRRRRP